MSAVYINSWVRNMCVTLTFALIGILTLLSFFVANFYNDLFISDYFSIMGPPFFIGLWDARISGS